MSLSGATNEEKIWNYLSKKIGNDYGVAGLMGNMYAESGFNPQNMENAYEKKLGYTDETYTKAIDDGSYTNFVHDAVGYGLCQFTYYTLKEALLNFAKEKNKSIGDLEMQLEFTCYILEKDFPAVWDILQNTPTIIQAATYVLEEFERPAILSVSVRSQRTKYGVGFYNKYAKSKSQGGANTMAYTADKLVSIARNEIGYKEKASNSNLDSKTANAGHNNWTKYARDLNVKGYYNGPKNGYAWCDMFVDWCFLQLAEGDAKKAQELECQTGDLGAACPYSLGYYKNQGRFYTSPQVGDQVFFQQGGSVVHTGIVESYTSTTVTTIEGNAGDAVTRKTYSRSNSYVYGYGRPKYDKSATGSGSSPAPSAPSGGTSATNIKTFQKWLNSKFSSFGLTVDGAYGPKTKAAAIKAFQYGMNETFKCGLAIDGVYGAKSQQAITKHPLQRGHKNVAVGVLQGMLLVVGQNPGNIDSEYGTTTESAVKAYQKANGLIADGEAGVNTFNSLFAL